MRSQGEIGVECPYVTLLAKLPQGLGQIIRNESKVASKQPLFEFGHFPTRKVIVQTVKECRVNHCLRQIGEPGCRCDQLLRRLTRVPNKDDGGLRGSLVLASC